MGQIRWSTVSRRPEAAVNPPYLPFLTGVEPSTLDRDRGQAGPCRSGSSGLRCERARIRRSFDRPRRAAVTLARHDPRFDEHAIAWI